MIKIAILPLLAAAQHAERLTEVKQIDAGQIRMWYWAEAEPQDADKLKSGSNAKLVMRVHWHNFEGP